MRHRIAMILVDDEHAPEDVDELVNEVFMLAWHKWDEPRNITLRWLAVVADNKIRDRRRRQLVKSRAMDAFAQMLIPDSSGWDVWDRLAVRSALNGLKEREKQALELSYGAGWSASEIASRLKMTPSAVGAMLTRSRAKIRAAVEDSAVVSTGRTDISEYNRARSAAHIA